jgi:PKD repeat protein
MRRRQIGWFRRVALSTAGIGVVLLAVAEPVAALPVTSTPTLQLARVIHTAPFDNTTTSMRDGEGSAYVPRDDSLWLLDDNAGRAYEVNRATGALKRVILNSEFQAAPRYGGGGPAGIEGADDLESMAYDPAADVLYAFSGPCCSSSEVPTAFRLTRGADGRFHVESHQPLPAGSNFTAAALRPSDSKLYVGVGSALREYTYTTNTVGSTFSVSGLSGIQGMGFSDDGADLFVVTGAERLYRVNWATKAIVSGWVFDLTPFGVRDSRAVELVGNQFYVLDGDDARASGDPLKYAVFVFDVLGAATPTPPVASFSASPTSGPAPLVVHFTDTSTNSPTSWSWDFGDGATSTQQNPTHTYYIGNTYSVTLRVSNPDGADVLTRVGLITVSGSVRVFNPIADSHVNSHAPTKNYGSATALKAGLGSNEYRPYLKFEVTGLTAAPTAAKLRLYVTNPGPSTGNWYAVASTWTESAINWSNAPTIAGAPAAGPVAAPSGAWVEVDLTSLVRANGTYSVGMIATSRDAVAFSSREASQPPQLVVTSPS